MGFSLKQKDHKIDRFHKKEQEIARSRSRSEAHGILLGIAEGGGLEGRFLGGFLFLMGCFVRFYDVLWGFIKFYKVVQ